MAIANGITVPPDDPAARERIRAEFGIGQAPTLVVTSRLHPMKGHTHLLDALAMLRQSFADLRRQMHGVTPLNGEGPICASVRKMSFDEASECAASVVTLYGGISRMLDDTQASLPLNEVEEARVPPFLVKSV